MSSPVSTPSHKLNPHVVTTLLAGDQIDDDDFDEILPLRLSRVSDVQWSSVRVARIVAKMLNDQASDLPGSFIDLGCGVGKLCLLLALTTTWKISGIERRSSLIWWCKKLAEENALAVDFIQGDILDLDWSRYDVLYLYNPFMEHTCSPRSNNLIDHNIQLGREAYQRYVNGCIEKLKSLREGQRVITYHGFGGKMPETLQLFSAEKVGAGSVRLWGT